MFIKIIALIILIIGVIGVLLGGLWLLQGLGVVHIRPILCVAACQPVEGPSLLWAGIGLVVLAAGGFAIFHALRRRSGPNPGLD